MKNYWIMPALTLVLIFGCKEKKDEKKEPPISAISIIKGQLHKLDSGMYEFKKIERTGNTNDTTYLKLDEIRRLAEPFLSLPDIVDKKNHKKYGEERLIDAEQGTLSIISTLNQGEIGEIQKQMLIIDLFGDPNAKVHSIFIETYKKLADTVIEQKLFWEIDKYFTILTETGDRAEKSEYVKVQWQ